MRVLFIAVALVLTLVACALLFRSVSQPNDVAESKHDNVRVTLRGVFDACSKGPTLNATGETGILGAAIESGRIARVGWHFVGGHWQKDGCYYEALNAPSVGLVVISWPEKRGGPAFGWIQGGFRESPPDFSRAACDLSSLRTWTPAGSN
jgi:hypothetical protein